MRKLLALLSVTVLLGFIAAGCDDDSGGGGGGEELCGNGICDEGEDATSCPADCGCGNGVLNPGEECDGTDFGGKTCESLGYKGGTLSCTAECKIDDSACESEPEPECGNGVREGTEECDGTDLGDYTCEDFNYQGGTLGCTDECKFDFSQCESGPECGNGVVEQGEECDGTNLNNKTCEDLGYDGGILGCSSCSYDTSQCCNNSCDQEGALRCNGDAVEVCAMSALGCLEWQTDEDCSQNGETCIEFGGTAQCYSNEDRGDLCAAPILLASFPFTMSGTAFTQDFADDVDYTDSTDCSYAKNSEAFFLVHLEVGQKLVAEENGSMDAVWRIITDCDPAVAQCLASVDYLDKLEFVPETSGDYILVLEKYSSYSSAADEYDVVIDVVPFEPVCDDGQDNDGDGKVDCLDPDCFGVAGACDTEDSTALCSDGEDNDGDGNADCLDPDCFGMPGVCDHESSAAVCGDGTDNDGDGAVDCDDEDCAPFPACQPLRGVWQRFTGSQPNLMDLGGMMIRFVPDGTDYRWEATQLPTADYLVQPGSGDATMVIDFTEYDDAIRVDLGQGGTMGTFTFFGLSYDWISVSDNGQITLGVVDDAYSTWGDTTFIRYPRIAAHMTDFDMRDSTSLIYVDFFADKVVVTWDQMIEFPYSSSSSDRASFQAVLHADGSIEIAIKSTTFTDDAIVGITNGGNTSVGDEAHRVDFYDTAPTPLINEVLPNTSFGSADPDFEFVELSCPVANRPLDGFYLVYFDAEDSTAPYKWYIDLSGYTTDSEGYFTVGGTALGTPDMTWDEAGIVAPYGNGGFLSYGTAGLALVRNYDPNTGAGEVIDVVVWYDKYDTTPVSTVPTEGTPIDGIDYGNWLTSIARIPDSTDTDDNSVDFDRQLYPTLGEENIRAMPSQSVYARVDAWGNADTDSYPIMIPDNDATGIVATIEIPWWLDGDTIQNLRVGVKIKHDYIGDLRVILESPDGTEVYLHDRTGSGGDEIIGVYGDDLTVDDATNTLDVFQGVTLTKNTVWKLKVSDLASHDMGILVDWTLFVETQP